MRLTPRLSALACAAMLTTIGTGAARGEEWTIVTDGLDPFHLPHDITSGIITVTLIGGAGGWAVDGNEHGHGGMGARMSFGLDIGTGAGQIPPGSELRCRPGQPGDSRETSGAGAGGGGGGSWVDPDSRLSQNLSGSMIE